MVGPFEHGNESLGAIKFHERREFLNWMSNYSLLKKSTLWSLLVSHVHIKKLFLEICY